RHLSRPDERGQVPRGREAEIARRCRHRHFGAARHDGAQCAGFLEKLAAVSSLMHQPLDRWKPGCFPTNSAIFTPGSAAALSAASWPIMTDARVVFPLTMFGTTLASAIMDSQVDARTLHRVGPALCRILRPLRLFFRIAVAV